MYDRTLIFTRRTSKIKDEYDLTHAISLSTIFTSSLYCELKPTNCGEIPWWIQLKYKYIFSHQNYWLNRSAKNCKHFVVCLFNSRSRIDLSFIFFYFFLFFYVIYLSFINGCEGVLSHFLFLVYLFSFISFLWRIILFIHFKLCW